MKTAIILIVLVLLVGCEKEPPEPNIVVDSNLMARCEAELDAIDELLRFAINEEPIEALLYFDHREGRVKFEGNLDLAAQRLFEMLRSEVDEYIKEHCE